jgi:hypothetical protein
LRQIFPVDSHEVVRVGVLVVTLPAHLPKSS